MNALGALPKIVESRASSVCDNCPLPLSATKLLTEEMTPAAFVRALLDNKQYVPAIDFMAHALPAREAVWWACLAIQHSSGDALAGPEKEACRAAVRWVLKPTQENRVMARAPGEAAGPATAAGAAAVGASIGGIPGSYTTAKAVSNSVKLSSIKSEPARIADTQRLLIELGLGIAEGRYM